MTINDSVRLDNDTSWWWRVRGAMVLLIAGWAALVSLYLALLAGDWYLTRLALAGAWLLWLLAGCWLLHTPVPHADHAQLCRQAIMICFLGLLGAAWPWDFPLLVWSLFSVWCWLILLGNLINMLRQQVNCWPQGNHRRGLIYPTVVYYPPLALLWVVLAVCGGVHWPAALLLPLLLMAWFGLYALLLVVPIFTRRPLQ